MSDIIDRSDHQEKRVDSNDDVVSQLGVRIQRMSGPPWLSFSDRITSDHISTVLGTWESHKRLTLMKERGHVVSALVM